MMSESVYQGPRKLGLLQLLRMADRNAELLTAPSRAVVMDQRWHVKRLGEGEERLQFRIVRCNPRVLHS